MPCRRFDLVAQSFTSWNQMSSWMRQLDDLKKAA
jgi:hypothetical protein